MVLTDRVGGVASAAGSPLVTLPGLVDAVLAATVVELARPAGERVHLLDPTPAPAADDLAVPRLVELVPAAVLVVLEPHPALLAADVVHPVPPRADPAAALRSAEHTP